MKKSSQFNEMNTIPETKKQHITPSLRIVCLKERRSILKDSDRTTEDYTKEEYDGDWED